MTCIENHGLEAHEVESWHPIIGLAEQGHRKVKIINTKKKLEVCGGIKNGCCVVMARQCSS